MAADIAEFIKAHRLANVSLMGHSMGGLATMAFSQLYPSFQKLVDNLIIVDISNKVGTVGTNFQIMLEKLSFLDMNRPLEHIYEDLEDPAQGNKEVIGLLKTNIEPDPSKPNGHRWKPNVQTLSDEYENMLDYYISKPTEWTNPVDVIYGEDSEYVDDASLAGFKKLYRNFTDSNVYPIKHAGHWLHFEQSTQFLADVDDIFKKYKK
jgi:esterase